MVAHNYNPSYSEAGVGRSWSQTGLAKGMENKLKARELGGGSGGTQVVEPFPSKLQAGSKFNPQCHQNNDTNNDHKLPESILSMHHKIPNMYNSSWRSLVFSWLILGKFSEVKILRVEQNPHSHPHVFLPPPQTRITDFIFA